MPHEVPTIPIPANVPNNTARIRVQGLSVELATWLEGEHPQLASELALAHARPVGHAEDEPTISVESLPEHTRRLLWRAMRRCRPALAQLLQDPVISDARKIFGARIHLPASDVLALVAAAQSCPTHPPS